MYMLINMDVLAVYSDAGLSTFWTVSEETDTDAAFNRPLAVGRSTAHLAISVRTWAELTV